MISIHVYGHLSRTLGVQQRYSCPLPPPPPGTYTGYNALQSQKAVSVQLVPFGFADRRDKG